MSTSKYNDLHPPIIIDIGSKTTKYVHQFHYTNIPTEQVSSDKNKAHNSNESNIDPNKEFDKYSHVKTFETNVCNSESELKSECTFKYKKTFVLREKQKNYFLNEGLFADDIMKWSEFWEDKIKKIQNDIGENDFNETPLIIMHDSVNSEKFQEKVKKMYDILFNKFHAQYVMICSSAMVNLFSYNITDGIVVDLGDSKTSITSVRDGFTKYSNNIHVPLLSGRTITAVAAIQKKNKDFTDTTIDYESYNCEEKEKIHSYDNSYKNKDNLFGCLNYLYLYPEEFRSIFQKTKSNNSFLYFLNDLQTYDEEKRNRMISAKYKSKQILSFGRNDSFLLEEKKDAYDDMFIENSLNGENKLIKENALSYGRQYSLSHLIANQIKMEYGEEMKRDVDIVFCGGVLETPDIIEMIKNDLNSSIEMENIHLHFPDTKKAHVAFTKGANYLSKLTGIENLMISKSDFNELGEEKMCFNYV